MGVVKWAGRRDGNGGERRSVQVAWRDVSVEMQETHINLSESSVFSIVAWEIINCCRGIYSTASSYESS